MYFVGNYFKPGSTSEEAISVLLVVFWVVEFLTFAKDLSVAPSRLWNSASTSLRVSEIKKFL